MKAYKLVTLFCLCPLVLLKATTNQTVDPTTVLEQIETTQREKQVALQAYHHATFKLRERERKFRALRPTQLRLYLASDRSDAILNVAYEASLQEEISERGQSTSLHQAEQSLWVRLLWLPIGLLIALLFKLRGFPWYKRGVKNV